MTVEFVPARPRERSAPRKRLSLRGVVLVSAMAAWVTCAMGACSDRADDARVALTTSAARELAQTQPAPAISATPAPQQGAASLADAISTSSVSQDSANGSAAISAQAIRSPARAPAPPDGASGADSLNSGADLANSATSNAPLAPPEIHTAD
ncbi:hypothetical protein F4827_006279 [Paraburkholderia bannensis]|uniref:Uncharacterized protein n=1 Tax=Paraburkholderia bannensis TaxID=765414 RepID=A0A7W9U3S3_9BURK|nr:MULTISPECIES: hypothetical protein [Paraburkholderia]MBB3261442.1 hypothetical protein [Paraburkholderia sp. WP4_3_2]MBB6106404.1 hypothetical protein [Paraburkholderia bannensis]